MSNPQYVSLPGELPLSLMRPSDLGLYALIHSLSGLPKEYHFSTSGLSVYANGKCAAVRSALKRLSGLGLISVDRPKVTSATMQISFSETFGKSVPVWNGYLFRKDLSLEAKGIAIGMQLAISVSARELAKKIKASRSTIQRYQKELCESHVILLIGSRSDDGKFAYNDAMLLGSDGGPAVRLLQKRVVLLVAQAVHQKPWLKIVRQIKSLTLKIQNLLTTIQFLSSIIKLTPPTSPRPMKS